MRRFWGTGILTVLEDGGLRINCEVLAVRRKKM